MKGKLAILAMGIACMLLTLALPAAGQTIPVDGAGTYMDEATGIGGTGAVSFLFVTGYTPWAAMVVNAGDPNGIDRVTLSFDDASDTLKIELTDSDSTNHATVLVNKAFAEKYIGEESDLNFKLSDAVNYQGLQGSNATAGGAVYVFQVTHFSTQTIEITEKGSALPHPGILPIIGIISIVAIIAGRKRKN